MQYILTEEEYNKIRANRKSFDKLIQAERSLELARMLILDGYECYQDDDEPDHSVECCDYCPLGKLFNDEAINDEDWEIICGRSPEFSE